MESALRTVKLVVAGIGGFGFVAVAVIGLTAPWNESGPDFPLLTWMSVTWAVVAFGFRILVLRQVEADGRRRIADGSYAASSASGQSALIQEHGAKGKLFLVYQTRAILSAALMEGAAFFCAIAGRVESNPIGFGAGLVLCVGILAEMPTASRWKEWSDRQERILRGA